MFGCLEIHFSENQFPCLVWSNILRKMEFVLRKINSHVWFIQTFFEKWNLFYGKSIHMFGLFKHFTNNMKCLATFVEKMLARQFTHFLIGFKPTRTTFHCAPIITPTSTSSTSNFTCAPKLNGPILAQRQELGY